MKHNLPRAVAAAQANSRALIEILRQPVEPGTPDWEAEREPRERRPGLRHTYRRVLPRNVKWEPGLPSSKLVLTPLINGEPAADPIEISDRHPWTTEIEDAQKVALALAGYDPANRWEELHRSGFRNQWEWYYAEGDIIDRWGF